MWTEKLGLPFNFALVAFKHKIKISIHTFLINSQARLSLHPPPYHSPWPHTIPAPHFPKKEKGGRVKRSRSAEELKQKSGDPEAPSLWQKAQPAGAATSIPLLSSSLIVGTHLPSCPGPVLFQEDNRESQAWSMLHALPSVGSNHGVGSDRSLCMYH